MVLSSKLGVGEQLAREHRLRGGTLYWKNCVVWKSHMHRPGGEAKGKTQMHLQLSPQDTSRWDYPGDSGKEYLNSLSA